MLGGKELPPGDNFPGLARSEIAGNFRGSLIDGLARLL